MRDWQDTAIARFQTSDIIGPLSLSPVATLISQTPDAFPIIIKLTGCRSLCFSFSFPPSVHLFYWISVSLSGSEFPQELFCWPFCRSRFFRNLWIVYFIKEFFLPSKSAQQIQHTKNGSPLIAILECVLL